MRRIGGTLLQREKLRELGAARPVERDGYQCAAQRERANTSYQCRGIMVATWCVLTRAEAITCSSCGRVALAEPEGNP